MTSYEFYSRIEADCIGRICYDADMQRWIIISNNKWRNDLLQRRAQTRADLDSPCTGLDSTIPVRAGEFNSFLYTYAFTPETYHAKLFVMERSLGVDLYWHTSEKLFRVTNLPSQELDHIKQQLAAHGYFKLDWGGNAYDPDFTDYVKRSWPYADLKTKLQWLDDIKSNEAMHFRPYVETI